MRKSGTARVEWPTLLIGLLCYFLWVVGVVFIAAFWLPAGIAVTGFAIALHSSLQHEVIHGHPFKSKTLSEALVFPALGLFIPYLRFRDTHLEHHNDSVLTDPYDDPETNYKDPAVWNGLPNAIKRLLGFNNTLLGRLLVGPAVSQFAFVKDDIKRMRNGNRQVLVGWLVHLIALVPVVVFVGTFGDMPIWAYLISAYIGLSILKIRTFLEHQAHEHTAGRTVIIEDRGILSFMFLNNNFHLVHHMHPDVAWYSLPALYFSNKKRYLERNNSYVYGSYREVFRRYFIKAKDQVSHPLWRP